MKPENRNWIVTLSALFALLLAVVAVVYLLYSPYSFVQILRHETPDASNSFSAESIFGQITPIAYTTPLPEPMSTDLDGVYARIDPSPPQWWTCRRCADYRLSGGIWRLQLDRGVMRIVYDVTGWHSLASFTVSGDQLRLFNDPYCPEDVGLYRWQLVDGALDLQVIDDACAFRLRGENISSQVWSKCPLPDEIAGMGGGWELPAGCTLNPTPLEAVASPASLNVSVSTGDSRFYEKPPDVFAPANSADAPPPDGIQVTYSPESVSMGLNRILWWGGDWIEASTDLPFDSMGVQFLGESQMGWARLLVDGQVVWQGDVSEIGVEKQRHGGFVEVTGFKPGRHTLRVESMGFDYRPVTVASFGFSYQGGVQAAAQ